MAQAKNFLALRKAARRGRLDVVQKLVETCGFNGDDIRKPKMGITPLHLAISSGNVELVEYLCKLFDVKQCDVNAAFVGDGHIRVCAMDGHVDMLEYLKTAVGITKLDPYMAWRLLDDGDYEAVRVLFQVWPDVKQEAIKILTEM